MSVNLTDILFVARRVLEKVDADDAAELFSAIQDMRTELMAYRAGAQKRTLGDAELVAELDQRLASMDAGERLKAIMERTGFGRSKVYKLRSLRSPRPTRNPHPTRTVNS